MITALAPECKVSSMAHVVCFGQEPGSGRGRTDVARGAGFLNAIQQPPPLCVQ